MAPFRNGMPSCDLRCVFDDRADVEEHSNFATDVSGRKLTYKVLVKNQKVLAVLYQLGNQVKRAAFVERPVPAVNTTVLLPGNKYAACLDACELCT